MLLYKSAFINIFDQKAYEKQIRSISFSSISCPKCHDTGTLSFYGHYHRSLYTSNGKIRLKVHRCSCSSCSSTHAILPSFIIPFSALSLHDACDILQPSDTYQLEELMVRLDISMRTVRETRFKFTLLWKKIIPSFDSFSHFLLTETCISSFDLQFLQIRFIYLSLVPT